MDLHAAEQAAGRLSRRERFFVDSALLAGISVVACVVAWVLMRSAVIPLMAIAGIQGCVTFCAYFVRSDELQRLALEPSAQEIPAVKAYCASLLRQSRRDRMAASIYSLISEAHLPLSFGLRDRILMVEDQLRTLARELATPHLTIQSRSMVLCLQLMTNGVESPLYNDNLTVEQLRSTLLRIRFGIGSKAA